VPGNAARSLSDVVTSIRSSLRRTDRSNPENALTRFPGARSLVPMSRSLRITTRTVTTRYVKRTVSMKSGLKKLELFVYINVLTIVVITYIVLR
jgi:hypothetical protein